MDFLGALGSAVTGLAGGGFLGAILGIGSKFLQERQRQQWQEKVWKHETALLKLQSQARASETEAELEIVREAGAWTAKQQSMQMDQAVVGSERLSGWVLNMRSLWRLALTLILAALVWRIWVSLIGLLWGESSVLEFLSPEAVVDLLSYIVYSVVFASSTAALWWFGDRALSPPRHRAPSSPKKKEKPETTGQPS